MLWYKKGSYSVFLFCTVFLDTVQEVIKISFSLLLYIKVAFKLAQQSEKETFGWSQYKDSIFSNICWNMLNPMGGLFAEKKMQLPDIFHSINLVYLNAVLIYILYTN